MDIGPIIEAIFLGIDGSFNPHTGETPDSGYMVGGVSYTVTVTPENFEPEYVVSFVKAHESLLKVGAFYVGWWTHQGRIYLDICENLVFREFAVKLGRERKEIAVWDVLNKEEISCEL